MNSAWLRYVPQVIRIRLDGRHNLQKVIGNTGWLFVDKILRMGVGLAVGVWLARYLGPGQFGLYSYAGAFVALFSALATLGLDSIVVRDLVRDVAAKDEILGAAFALKLSGGIVTLLLTVATISWLRPADHLTHWLVAIIAATTIFQAFDAIDFWFQARVESKFSVYAKNGAFLLISVARIGLILIGASLLAFAWATLAEIALGSFALLLIYRIGGQHISAWKVHARQAKRLLGESWPLILTGIAVMVYMRIDQVMLGEMLGDKAVGLYTAATRISEAWYFIPTAIVSSVSPTIFQAKTGNPRLYEEQMARLLRLMVLLALSIAVPVTFLADRLIETVFGSDFNGAGNVLVIHMWAAVFVFIGVAQGPWVLNEGLTRLMMPRTVLGVLINVVMNLVLIPTYGIVGAAIATLISQFCVVFVSNLLSPRTRPMFFMTLRALMLRGYA